MNNENKNSEQNVQQEQEQEQKTFAQQVEESVDFIVNMMNSGKANPRDVYPPGRYHGD
jgi:hypothetical protein